MKEEDGRGKVKPTAKWCVCYRALSCCASSYIPKFSRFSVGVLVQRELVDQFFDDSADVTSVDAAQSGVHLERLADGHLVNERVELWTEADLTTSGTCRALLHAHSGQERVTRRDDDVASQH